MVVESADKVPTAVGWFTVIFFEGEITEEQIPLEAMTLNHVSCVKVSDVK